MGKKVAVSVTPSGGDVSSSAIIQVRGTSGSGKSTCVKHLLTSLHSLKPVEYAATRRGTTDKVRVYRGLLFPDSVPVYVLGDYNDSRSAGGCDTIPSIQETAELVEKYGKQTGSVLVFEGLLLSHSWGALGEFIHPVWGERYINAFLDTPVDTCLERVLYRRANRGDETSAEREAKIEKNVREDYYRVELCWDRVAARGGMRVKIAHRNSKASLLRLVNEVYRLYCTSV